MSCTVNSHHSLHDYSEMLIASVCYNFPGEGEDPNVNNTWGREDWGTNRQVCFFFLPKAENRRKKEIPKNQKCKSSNKKGCKKVQINENTRNKKNKHTTGRHWRKHWRGHRWETQGGVTLRTRSELTKT